jgi:hypothetical protein
MRTGNSRWLAVLLFVCSAAAQRLEFSLLGGFAGSTNQLVAGSDITVKAQGGEVFQFSHGYRVESMQAVDIYIEMPFTWVFRGEATAGSQVLTSYNSTHFFTPGLKFRIVRNSRWAPYALAGGGFGSFGYNRGNVGPTGISVSSRRTTRGVFDFGGGIDFKLAGPVNLRAELRDFISAKGLDGTDGRHHVIPAFGVAIVR